MKPSICAGLRRRSLLRSAALRSGLATIAAIRSGDSSAAGALPPGLVQAASASSAKPQSVAGIDR